MTVTGKCAQVIPKKYKEKARYLCLQLNNREGVRPGERMTSWPEGKFADDDLMA